MKPLDFRTPKSRRPLGKGSRKANATAYWQAFAQGKPVAPAPFPGAEPAPTWLKRPA